MDWYQKLFLLKKPLQKSYTLKIIDFLFNTLSASFSVCNCPPPQCPLKDHKGAIRMKGLERLMDGRSGEALGSQSPSPLIYSSQFLLYNSPPLTLFLPIAPLHTSPFTHSSPFLPYSPPHLLSSSPFPSEIPAHLPLPRCKIGSQFMIWVGDLEYKEYRYTLVFGKIVEGFDELLEVSRIKVRRKPEQINLPAVPEKSLIRS